MPLIIIFPIFVNSGNIYQYSYFSNHLIIIAYYKQQSLEHWNIEELIQTWNHQYQVGILSCISHVSLLESMPRSSSQFVNVTVTKRETSSNQVVLFLSLSIGYKLREYSQCTCFQLGHVFYSVYPSVISVRPATASCTGNNSSSSSVAWLGQWVGGGAYVYNRQSDDDMVIK